jgi:serine/threonine-protein kinase
MELVDGVTLADRIGRGRLPLHEALDISRQLAAALEAAHGRGIVHRDLKPQNIKLKPDGTVKVLDFGIAKALDPRAMTGPQSPALTVPSMTEAGVVLGTAAYMSPEQARGQPVDKRADVWAFGCVLYEMLTARAAFLAEDATTTLARVLEREPDFGQLPADLPAAARGTIELCLQKDPKNRLHDIGDVRLALAGGLGALSSRTGKTRSLLRGMLPIAVGLVAGVLLGSAYVATRRSDAPAGPAVARATRFLVTPPATAPLSNAGGYDMTISPGGERIAYFAEHPDGRFTLYVRELDALEAREIPGTDVTGGIMNLFFSPDGKNIGFFVPDRGLVRVGLDGAPPLKIMNPPQPTFLGAAWAEDDTVILSAGPILQRVPARGGVPETLTQPHETRLIASPALLPGGRALLFGEIEGSIERVAVLDLSTGERKVLIEGAQVPHYAATGHIVFARGTTLMAVPFDLAELAVTGEAVVLVERVRHPSSQTAADFALSETGTLVYVPAGDDSTGGAEVVWVNRSGNVISLPVTSTRDNPRDPSLSPDGTRLLLTTGPTTGGQIWSYDLRGRPPIPLVQNNNLSAVWSPDSRQIAFASWTLFPRVDTYTTLADGSALSPSRVAAGDLGGVPRAWSADGEILGVRSLNGSPKIQAMPAAGDGAPRLVSRTEFSEMDPALSPDGRWLAYASDRSGRNEIWIQGYPDGVPVRVSADGGYEPRWSADGRELFYLQGNAMMAVAVETSAGLSFESPVQLFTGSFFASPDPFTSSYDVAGDGRFLLMQTGGSSARGAPSESIVVVENWTQELRRRVPPR